MHAKFHCCGTTSSSQPMNFSAHPHRLDCVAVVFLIEMPEPMGMCKIHKQIPCEKLSEY